MTQNNSRAGAPLVYLVRYSQVQERDELGTPTQSTSDKHEGATMFVTDMRERAINLAEEYVGLPGADRSASIMITPRAAMPGLAKAPAPKDPAREKPAKH